MNFKAYQDEAAKTDQFASDSRRSLDTSIQNLLTEVFSLHQFYLEAMSKRRSGAEMKATLAGKVGDVLWYLANFSRLSGFSLEDAAIRNLRYIAETFGSKDENEKSSRDTAFQLENLPKKIEIAFVGDGRFLILATKLGNREYIQLGDRINDNSGANDFYRYHDVFHLAYMAILNWSPVMRALFKRKRKNDPKVDEEQDGARAADLEEAITAFVFQHASRKHWFKSRQPLDFELLRTIRTLTTHLEVRERTFEEWERAILEGYRVFGLLKKHKGGVIAVDRVARKITFRKKETVAKELQVLFKQYGKQGALKSEHELARQSQRTIEKGISKIYRKGRRKTAAVEPKKSA